MCRRAVRSPDTGPFRLLALLLCAFAASAMAAERRPNIVLILADDLGYGDLGCYGQRQIKTPNIDRLASEGVRFTQCYAGSTVCAPSRCVLMTGLHTGHAAIRGNRDVEPMGQLPLPGDTITVARLLQQAGYSTALVGKWGLGGLTSTGRPSRQGFDYFYGYLCQWHAHNYYPEFLFRGDERIPLPGNEVVQPRPRPAGAGVAVKRSQYSHDLLIGEALTFLERQTKDRPFFLYLALTVPHANNEAGADGMEVPDYGPYADRKWPAPQKGHAAMITRMDADVGRLLSLLKARGLDEVTVLFFTSDNGPHCEGGADPAFFDSNGPLRGIKRDLYEGGIRIPMIVRQPGRIRPGQVSSQVWAFQDFLPTAAELAGVPPPGRLDGISVLPTMLSQPERQRQHDFLYWEFHEGVFRQAVRMGDWKAVRGGPGGALELYDLRNDPAEAANVAKHHADVVARIEEYLTGARTESPYWPVKPSKSE